MSMHEGQRVTLLKVDDMMAMTHRYEFTVSEVLPPAKVGYEGRNLRVGMVKQRGKRKEVYLDLRHDDILLDGWDVPFKADTECAGVFSGNACYNLVGDAAAIKEWIETKAVFPVSNGAKGKIIVMAGPRTKCDDSGLVLLYPEVDARHAVIDRMKAV